MYISGTEGNTWWCVTVCDAAQRHLNCSDEPSRCCGALSSNREDEREQPVANHGRCYASLHISDVFDLRRLFWGLQTVSRGPAGPMEHQKVLWILVKVRRGNSFSLCFFFCSFFLFVSAVLSPVLQWRIVLRGVKGLSPLSTLRGQRQITHFLLSNRSDFSLEVQAFGASQQLLLLSGDVRNLQQP